MKAITYLVTLEEPALVSALGGDPNGSSAFAYLPGSVLRGAVLAAYLRRRRRAEPDYQLDAALPDARRLFFDGSTRYLNGYLHESGRRALPTPRSWYQQKGRELELRDLAIHPLAADDTERWEGLPQAFCWPEEDSVRFVLPTRQVAVHTSRNRRLGRPQERTRVLAGEDAGAIHRYESLAAGQTFAAAILCDHDEDAEGVRDLLQEHVLLGGSRNGGYGRALIHDVSINSDWRETDDPAELLEGGFLLTLLSDALVRDEQGQFVASAAAVRRAVAARLGVPDLPSPEAWFLRPELVGGFNRKWGLPLPQAVAVAMGSVFVFRQTSIRPEALRSLLALGIGERRAEGFGRVAVNWHVRSEWSVYKPEARPTVSPVRFQSETEGKRLALQMTERMLRHRLDGGLGAVAVKLGGLVRHPSKSQLNRLRLILHDALGQPPAAGRKRVLEYLADLEERQAARKQFARDRVQGRPLLDWLRWRVADGADVWEVLEVRKLPRVGGVQPERTDDLIYEYNLRLLDAVLARAAKERRKENA